MIIDKKGEQGLVPTLSLINPHKMEGMNENQGNSQENRSHPADMERPGFSIDHCRRLFTLGTSSPIKRAR